MPATSAWCILAGGALGRHLRGRTRRRSHGPQTLALRYSAGPRVAMNGELLHGDNGLELRGLLLTAGQALPTNDCTVPLAQYDKPT